MWVHNVKVLRFKHSLFWKSFLLLPGFSVLKRASNWEIFSKNITIFLWLKNNWYLQAFARFIVSLNFVLPTLSWILVFNDTSPALNECLGKGYLNFFSTKSQLCSNEFQFGNIFCWIWLSLLGILMSNIVDLFSIFFIFKDINKATQESRHMLSNQAYLNRKRYDKILLKPNYF